MHDLQYCLSAARRVASTVSQPRRLQSSVTLSSQRFLGRPLALFPSTLPYRAMYGRRHICMGLLHTKNKAPTFLKTKISHHCALLNFTASIFHLQQFNHRLLSPSILCYFTSHDIIIFQFQTQYTNNLDIFTEQVI